MRYNKSVGRGHGSRPVRGLKECLVILVGRGCVTVCGQ
jgi:hypothetical protein